MISLVESIISSTGVGKASKEIDGYHIGDIIVAVYQYSSRHVHFYELVDIQGKATAVVRELSQRIVRDDGYGQNGTCLPVEGKYVGKEEKVRVGRRGLRIGDYYCYKFEGREEDFYTD